MDKQQYLREASERELRWELTRRRQDFLQAQCTSEEIEEELARRSVDCGKETPPKYVEK